ncbi:MAG: protein phosphatase 2C domain-containing protein [Candidatus Bilamarchaeaceae archaeon]
MNNQGIKRRPAQTGDRLTVLRMTGKGLVEDMRRNPDGVERIGLVTLPFGEGAMMMRKGPAEGRCDDSAVLLGAQGKAGPFILAAVMDGIGSDALSYELTSAAVEIILEEFASKRCMDAGPGGNPELLRLAKTLDSAAMKKRLGGTTLSMALVMGDGSVMTLNCGDSSIYLIDGSGCRLALPRDRGIVVMEKTTMNDYRGQRSGLTNHIGSRNMIAPHLNAFKMDGDLRLVLATDGITDNLGIRIMKQTMLPADFGLRRDRFDVLDDSGADDMAAMSKGASPVRMLERINTALSANAGKRPTVTYGNDDTGRMVLPKKDDATAIVIDLRIPPA